MQRSGRHPLTLPMLGVHSRLDLGGNVGDVGPSRHHGGHQVPVFGLQFVSVFEHLLGGLPRQLIETVSGVLHLSDLLGALEFDEQHHRVDVVAMEALHHGYGAIQHAVEVGLGDSTDGGHRYALVAGAPSAIFEDEAFGKLTVQLGLGTTAGVGSCPSELLGEF